MEAVALLEQNETYGNMLLRPGRDGKSFSLTARQKVNGTVSIRHYKINTVGGEYIIVMEKPNYCSSLTAVLDFFVAKTNGILMPLSVEKNYALALEVMETDQENKRSILMSAWVPDAPQPPSKCTGDLVGKKRVFSPGCQLSPPPPLPPIMPILPPRRALAPAPEHVYEEEDPPQKTYVNKEAAWGQPEGQEVRPKGATPAVPVPPKPLKRPPKSGSLLDSKSTLKLGVHSTTGETPLSRSITDNLTQELKQKLEERMARIGN